ncbi:MAG: tetratricopeptide repeat protein [Bacteroidetes bacterium]|jgi:uncharacterized protein (TIGR02145 family)|nr:tetratricopeptide repeat protein [Bacteroidota bacterium]MBT4400436.1 tetratricopeptide repeat protein [Bacteroidota bacterium]MBT4411548.1 tetratricopeptide repeat protein [Bacteroidota bacterium]MBT5425747.1 tetratricopeptide repeat protein [Bacteroidota bacterium]MBT7093157.1 tetratricopeptide repeat protein [Bacteroidota bacterium]
MKHIILIITAIVILGSPLRAQETTAADLMAKGLYEENINGDYEKASEYYQKIVDEYSSEKKLAAQATYRLGIAAEKLGRQTAQDYFVDVIEKYPIELELVSKARARINNTEGIKFFIDERDGHQYKYVAIGKYDWMVDNLAYLPSISSLKGEGGTWVYDYDGQNVQEAMLTDNYIKYGVLYSWDQAMQGCPNGWRLPSHSEWQNLENFLGINSPNPNEEGDDFRNYELYKKLIDSDDWRKWHYENITQFSALPGGTRFVSSRTGPIFYGLNSDGSYWTSTEDLQNEVWSRTIAGGIYGHIRNIAGRANSVRCIKDRDDILIDNENPSIDIRVPDPSSIVSKDVYIMTHAKDNLGIEKVEFWAASMDKTSLIGIDKSPNLYHKTTYEMLWNTVHYPDGEYSLKVVAIDYAGNQKDTTYRVTIKNQGYGGNTDGSFIDPRDGNKYKYVNIKEQVWMAENLNYVLAPGSGSWCYNNLDINCNNYGRLYNRETALYACPDGWKLPSDQDWMILEKNLGMPEIELDSIYGQRGRSIKITSGMVSESGWHGNNGNNSTGLNIEPAGIMDTDYFMFKDMMTTFWTSTPVGNYRSWIRSLSGGSGGIERTYGLTESYSFSVRCIKD